MATKTGLPTTREELVQMLINRKTPQARRTPNGICTYLHSANGGCAVGMAVSSATAIRMEGKRGCSIGEAIDNKTVPKRLSIFGEDFLLRVQTIHDNHETWWGLESAKIGSNGLIWNKTGVHMINEIIKEYGLTMGTI
jgi:hypothetical protein